MTSLVFINFKTFLKLLMVVYHSGDHTPNPAAGALLHRLENQQGIRLTGRQTDTDRQLLYTNYIHTKMLHLTSVCSTILIYSCHKPCFYNMYICHTKTALPGLWLVWNNKTEIPQHNKSTTLWNTPIHQTGLRSLLDFRVKYGLICFNCTNSTRH